MHLINLRKKIKQTLKIPNKQKVMKAMVKGIPRKISRMAKNKVKMNKVTKMKKLLKKIGKLR